MLLYATQRSLELGGCIQAAMSSNVARLAHITYEHAFNTAIPEGADCVKVTHVTYVETMDRALELTRGYAAVAALGVVGKSDYEQDVALAQDCRLYVDEDGHAMTVGRLKYLLDCAERRGAEKAQQRAARTKVRSTRSSKKARKSSTRKLGR